MAQIHCLLPAQRADNLHAALALEYMARADKSVSNIRCARSEDHYGNDRRIPGIHCASTEAEFPVSA